MVYGRRKKLLQRQGQLRALYLAQAELLKHSGDAVDQVLGAKVEVFVRSMPRPDSQRLALARELRRANGAVERQREANAKDRTR